MSEVLDAPAHAAFAAVAAIGAGLELLAEANLWSMADGESLRLRAELARLTAQLGSATLASTREVDSRQAAQALGASSTAAWLRSALLIHPAAAKREVALAEATTSGDLKATGEALAAGEMSVEQAQVVASAVQKLPRACDASMRRRGEEFLIEQARVFDPDALARLGRHLARAVDPDRGAAAEREEARQADRQEFTLTRGLDGRRILRGCFTPESGALIDAALDAVSEPRPATDGTPDPRSPANRRAEGVLDLVRMALDAPEMPEAGGEPVTVVITTPWTAMQQHRDADARNAGEAFTEGDAAGDTMDPHEVSEEDWFLDRWGSVLEHEDWVGDEGGPVLEDGTPISPAAAQRLGCDAFIVEAIVSHSGDVLDIGRLSRVVPRSMRRALVARDRGCAFPGCGRPPRWCHAHHIWHWAEGGPTALRNLVLLCGHHHRVMHHKGWTVHIGPDGTPVFTPPRWIDPQQLPRPANHTLWQTTLDGMPLRT